MPVVTISRQFGAGGSSVAEIVAAELHAEVVDKTLIEEVARRLHISASEVAAEDERPRPLLERLVRSFSTLEPTMGAGWSPPYPDPLFDPRNAIIQLTEEVIREVAAGGNVVIVGRGAGFCLRDRPNVFRVFLRAPEAVRVKTLMERFGLTRGRRTAQDARNRRQPRGLHSPALQEGLVRPGRVRPDREHGAVGIPGHGRDHPARPARAPPRGGAGRLSLDPPPALPSTGGCRDQFPGAPAGTTQAGPAWGAWSHWALLSGARESVMTLQLTKRASIQITTTTSKCRASSARMASS